MDLRRSHHHGWLEWLLTRVTMRRYLRCNDCGVRFLSPVHWLFTSK